MTRELTQDLTELFLAQRRTLIGVGYRLLGSMSEAEDATQRGFERLLAARAEGQHIADPRAWLVIVVSRICLDQLGSARSRRETYVGPWLPEPVVSDPDALDDPAERISLDETVSMGMLILLERLSPAERVAFVLHDVFGMEYAEVGRVVGRSQDACRQLASRARRRLRQAQGPVRATVDPKHQRVVAEEFLSACRSGELDRIAALLDAEVVLTADSGGAVQAPRKPVTGPRRIAKVISSGVERTAGLEFEHAMVNGGPGMVMRVGRQMVGVLALGIGENGIESLNLISNPAKLAHIDGGTRHGAADASGRVR